MTVTRRALVAAILATVGLVAIISGWVGVSGTRELSDQLAYLASGGVVGLALIALAGIVLVTDYMAAVQRQLDQIRQGDGSSGLRLDLTEDSPMATSPSRGGRPGHGQEHTAGLAEEDALELDGLLGVEGGTRVHRPACPITKGKATFALSSEEAVGAGLLPCRMCEPDLSVSAAP